MIGAMEALGEDECWRLIGPRSLGRIGLEIGRKVHIFPVNYAAGHGAVVFRTAEGLKLASGPGKLACFEVDAFDERSGTGWSVMVRGRVRDITDAVDAPAVALRALNLHPAAPGQRVHWLALEADEVTGRRFAGAPLAPPVTH